MRLQLRAIAAVAGLAALAGCQTDAPRGGLPAARVQTGFEGTWLDPTGGISTLNSGRFQTVALDTGEVLSEGRYTTTGSADISLSGISLARQRRNLPSDVSFNCRLANANQMYCTSSNNNNFVLTRRLVS